MSNVTDKYTLLKIPFVSKKKMNEILQVNKYGGKRSFAGDAYYVVDTSNYCIVWERAVMREVEYRPTDSDMLKTDFYEDYFIKKGLDRRDIMPWSDINKDTAKADDEMINKINQYSLKYLKTVLATEGTISGSNSTGADSTISASPILIDPRFDTNYSRFTNAIKRIRCHDKTLNNVFLDNLNEVKDIEKIFTKTITIEELENKNPIFNKWLHIFNSDIDTINTSQEDVLEYINLLKDNDIKNSIDQAIAMYQNEMIKEEKLITKLRREFRISLLKEAIENHFTEYAGNEDLSIYDTEAAHILGVSEIKKYKLDFSWIANPNNGLLISPELHTILDKKKVLLKEDGTFEAVDSEYENKINNKIKEVILNEERKEFIKLRNEYS